MTARIEVVLKISADEYLRLYQGTAKHVFARALDGRTIRFPARILQPYVRHDGINGHFAIFSSADGKFERIERIS